VEESIPERFTDNVEATLTIQGGEAVLNSSNGKCLPSSGPSDYGGEELPYSVAIGCEKLSTVNEQGGLPLPSSTTQSLVEPWKDPIVTIGLFGGTHAPKELVPAIPKHRVGAGTIDKSWTKYFTVDKVPGDGECYFSVNFERKLFLPFLTRWLMKMEI